MVSPQPGFGKPNRAMNGLNVHPAKRQGERLSPARCLFWYKPLYYQKIIKSYYASLVGY